MDIILALAEEFKLGEEQVRKTVELIDNGDFERHVNRVRRKIRKNAI